MSSLKKHPLITGTLLLTATGIASRFIGFFYRIYLSQLFGEEGMGIYQLLNPALSLSYALCAAGYQTAISKIVAEQAAKEKDAHTSRPMMVGISISVPLSLLCCGILFFFAKPIGNKLLLEPRTISLLRILSFSIPFSALHSCINGYFYGHKKAFVPAITQLAEQLIRIGCVAGITAYAAFLHQKPTIAVAVLGLTVGEFFSMLISVVSIYLVCFRKKVPYAKSTDLSSCQPKSFTMHSPASAHTLPARHQLYVGILNMAIPLSANRLVLNFLASAESVSIPARLKLYGYDQVTALSVYGVLTGMAMPLIFFPNALTGSVAVMLLPMISEQYALQNLAAVKAAALRTIKYCILLGIACFFVFFLFGNTIGKLMFHSALAGHFITTLSFICPFMYLDTTLSSILQGLGMAGQIFTINVSCLLLRLCFVFWLIPKVGISAYLWGILVSQFVLCILYLYCLKRFFSHS